MEPNSQHFVSRHTSVLHRLQSWGGLLGACLLIMALEGCQDRDKPNAPAPAQTMGIVQVGVGTTNRCYDITMTNLEEQRKIKDLHFALPVGAAQHIKAPVNWGWRVQPDGTLVFETPPTNLPPPPGGTATKPAENPVAPGKSLEGFRFCLTQLQQVSVVISYDQEPDSPATVIQGVEVGSGKSVHRTSVLRCAKLTITAPTNADVSDVHFGKAAGSSSPSFDDVELPPGWSGGASGNDAVDLDAGNAPIAKGQSASIGICVRGNPSKIDWKLTDKSHNDIPGASGSTNLSF